jgi:hypothetical protein
MESDPRIYTESVIATERQNWRIELSGPVVQLERDYPVEEDDSVSDSGL